MKDMFAWSKENDKPEYYDKLVTHNKRYWEEKMSFTAEAKRNIENKLIGD